MIKRANICMYVGAIYNIVAGIAVVVVDDWYLDWTGLMPAFHPLLQMFIGGTALVFGLGYLRAVNQPVELRALVVHGMWLKKWAFIASLYSFVLGTVSLPFFVSFGVTNLLLAFGFHGWLAQTKRPDPS